VNVVLSLLFLLEEKRKGGEGKGGEGKVGSHEPQSDKVLET
jgi:hypothetical protein